MKLPFVSALLLAVSSTLVPPALAESKPDDVSDDKWMDLRRTYLRGMQEAESSMVNSGQHIIGGFTQTTVLPWFVAILMCDSDGANCGSCGATLVHEDIVMTAAHCVDTHRLVPTWAVIGALNVDFSQQTHDGTLLSPVSGSLLIHPDWDTNNIQNGYDIAMFKISAVSDSKISWNADFTVPDDSQSLYIFGHGDTSNGGSSSVPLLGLETNAVVPCTSSDSSAIDQHVCIFASSSSGACSGDSGGPLVTSDVTSSVTSAVQLGLASYVRGSSSSDACAAGNPDVYIYTAFFDSWISDYICNNSGSGSEYCTDTPSCTFAARFVQDLEKRFGNWFGFGGY